MPYIIEKLPDEPIIIVDMADFDMAKDLQSYLKETQEVFGSLTEKTHMITDARHLKINFSGVVEGLAKLTRGENLFEHPNGGRMILVTGSNLMQMGAKAFGQNQYGGFIVEVYDTVDEALISLRGG